MRLTVVQTQAHQEIDLILSKLPDNQKRKVLGSFQKVSTPQDKGMNSTGLSLPSVERPMILSTCETKYKDKRVGFEPHKAFKFIIKDVPKGNLRDLLRVLLDCHQLDDLFDDWNLTGACSKNLRLDFNQRLPKTCEVVLFLDSCNKARSETYAPLGARTSQSEDFAATKHTFADDVHAMIVCATVLYKARCLDIDINIDPRDWTAIKKRDFGNCEFELLTKLFHGDLRTERASLRLEPNTRRLQACLASSTSSLPSNDSWKNEPSSAVWALGSKKTS